jgi:hypothetical protein
VDGDPSFAAALAGFLEDARRTAGPTLTRIEQSGATSIHGDVTLEGTYVAGRDLRVGEQLLLREGARDLRTGEPSNVQNYFDERVDIHHLFPQRWCRDQGIPPTLCDSIVNKTPLSAQTNRVIGGRAPSEYLSRLQNSAGIAADQLDAHLRTHLVDPALLRADDFQGFFAARQAALLGRIEQVTGKRIDPGSPPNPKPSRPTMRSSRATTTWKAMRRTSPPASPSSLANCQWATSCSARNQ